MEITLVRHAESLANAGVTDDVDSSLTDRGRRQARLTADWFRNDIARSGALERAYVSPFRRTIETFAPIYDATRVPAEVYGGVCEYFSDTDPRYDNFVGRSPSEILTGLSWVEGDSEFSRTAAWWPRRQENDKAIVARANVALDAVKRRYGNSRSRLLIVSHAETIGRLVEAMLGQTPQVDPPWTDNCGIWRIVVELNRPSIALLRNFTAHLVMLDSNAPGSR
jgi:broad specificity phosphatase PhoE